MGEGESPAAGSPGKWIAEGMENAEFCQYPDRMPALKAWSVSALCKVARIYRAKKVVPQVTNPVLFGQDFFIAIVTRFRASARVRFLLFYTPAS